VAGRLVGALGAARHGAGWSAGFGDPQARATADSLAAHARAQFGADIGIGLCGSVGHGTYAVAVDTGQVAGLAGRRSSTPAEVRRWAVYQALNVVWRAIAGKRL
jgi:nicotinamide mononucleotide (NMN) deamidase PncC